MTFDANERVGVYLEAFFCNLNLKSFNLGVIPNFDGDESEAEKMAKFSATEAKSQKLGLRILYRKNNVGDWIERAEIILVNRGRKDYFDLLQPYLAKNQVAILETNDALALQLIDYGNGLLKQGDSLFILAAITVSISKKNDIEALENRLASLELAIDGRLTNINPNHFLGREINQGVVTQIPFSRFATQATIDQAIMDMIGGAPEALNTIKELAQAMNDDANFASNVINSLATKAPLTNPLFTGNVSINGLSVLTKTIKHTNTGSDGYLSGIASADANLDGTIRGWHFLTLLRGDDANFGIQLALCDTASLVKYRHKFLGTWNPWINLT